MYAGMEAALGECAVIMDADLQHPPVMLEEMYRAITEEGYDIAAARRVSRKGEPPVRSLFARLFYKLINKISKAEFVDGASDFRMLSRPAVDALLRLGEYNRFSKGIFGWIGFKTKWIPYENVERVAGETTWSFWKLLLYSLDGIIAFSTAPLAIASLMGLLFCFPDRSFETVTCTHVLEHVPDMDAAVSELLRVTKKRLLIVLPRQREYRYTADLHIRFFPYEYNVRAALPVSARNARIFMVGSDWGILIDRETS